MNLIQYAFTTKKNRETNETISISIVNNFNFISCHCNAYMFNILIINIITVKNRTFQK